MEVQEQQQEHDKTINLGDVSRTLLKIVARLSKSEYHQHKSNGQHRRQAEVLEHSDLTDPASAPVQDTGEHYAGLRRIVPQEHNRALPLCTQLVSLTEAGRFQFRRKELSTDGQKPQTP